MLANKEGNALSDGSFSLVYIYTTVYTWKRSFARPLLASLHFHVDWSSTRFISPCHWLQFLREIQAKLSLVTVCFYSHRCYMDAVLFGYLRCCGFCAFSKEFVVLKIAVFSHRLDHQIMLLVYREIFTILSGFWMYYTFPRRLFNQHQMYILFRQVEFIRHTLNLSAYIFWVL